MSGPGFYSRVDPSGLRKCPFCGMTPAFRTREHSLQESGDGWDAEVHCTEKTCRARVIQWARTREQAMRYAENAWNRRV